MIRCVRVVFNLTFNISIMVWTPKFYRGVIVPRKLHGPKVL